jgi:hypothetical protein
MRKQVLIAVLAGCLACLASSGTAYAHHSASSQYDVEKVMSFKGVLTRVEWVNPHAHMTFDVTGKDGKTTPWVIEFFGVSGLHRMGLANKGVLKIGDTYSLEVSPARDGRPAGIIQSLKFPDGRVYSTASVPPELR